MGWLSVVYFSQEWATYVHISQNMDKDFPESVEITMWTNAGLLLAKPIVERWWVLLFVRLRLGFVHPLQDIALHQCLPLLSVAFLVQVVPSSVISSCHLLLDLFPLLGCHSAAFGPLIVLRSCFMTGPFPLLFQCVFYDINYLCFPDFWAWYLICIDCSLTFAYFKPFLGLK